MDELNKIPYGTFDALIKFILVNSRNEKFKGIDSKITTCNTHIVGIKDLKNTLESKEEAKKKQILMIMQHSVFRLNI